MERYDYCLLALRKLVSARLSGMYVTPYLLRLEFDKENSYIEIETTLKHFGSDGERYVVKSPRSGKLPSHVLGDRVKEVSITSDADFQVDFEGGGGLVLILGSALGNPGVFVSIGQDHLITFDDV